MAVVSVEAQNASLDNDYGTTRGPNAADSHECLLLDEDGIELVGNGYTRPTVLPADWPNADGGEKTVVLEFGTPTGVWVKAVTWQLLGDDGNLWDSVPIVPPLEVTGASVGPVPVAITVAYSQPVSI